jgi:ParB family chromosome partitioning protein
MKKSVLGKGILEIIGNEPQLKSGIVDIEIELIKPNPYQPRKSFSSESIQGLARSISESGLIQPIVVFKKDDFFYLIVGERRWRAAQLLKWEKIPAIIREFSDGDVEIGALIENLQREDLNAMEISDALSSIITKSSLTQEELSDKIGMNRATVANFLRLQKLPSEVKRLLTDNRLDQGHARALLAIEEPDRIVSLAKQISEKKLSVREAERLAGKESRKKTAQKMTDADIILLSNKLTEHFKTKSEIRIGSKGKGSVLINFYSKEDLSRLIEMLLRRS